MRQSWFANKGQIVQLAVTILACFFAGAKAWPDMRGNELLSLGAIVFYLLVGLVLLTLAIVAGRFTGGKEQHNTEADKLSPVPISLPDKRPIIAPTRYGPTKPISHHQGLHLTNEREPAYDIRIEAFRFANHTVTFDGIDRLAKEDSEKCLLAQISEIGAVQVHMLQLVLAQWQERTNALSVKIPLHIVYRDSEGHWYRSVCELERDSWNKDAGISVRFIRQEAASRPDGRQLWALKETWEPQQLPQ